MSRRFEDLCETLLRAGVAPRHVRRYERELEEHLDDLVAMQVARGYDGEDAACRARALLGPDEELAAAMIQRRAFRSLAARAPWLVFGLVPPFLIFFLLAGAGFMMWGAWALLPGLHAAPPSWAGPFVTAWSALSCAAAGPLAAVFFTVIAVRQRQNWRWPAFGVVSAALFSAFAIFVVRLPEKGRLGELGLGFGATPMTLGQNLTRLGLTAAAAIAAYAVLRRQIRARA